MHGNQCDYIFKHNVFNVSHMYNERFGSLRVIFSYVATSVNLKLSGGYHE